ncbi:FAD-binding domain-containing protein [Trichoderma reesei RUT C-30]|uniref:FAD-binding domain-containing protein n=1 Tax=Hypocrea jecorina (strain ATCC 56765 / BCRC 32924 / NRRL 11460 / Rut C-30) TaxID=1344414 RepID=A0A024SGV5_HYPJR|nr:FAD-binding domain-containing protein [Trichoderma reesei RUT C-30]
MRLAESTIATALAAAGAVSAASLDGCSDYFSLQESTLVPACIVRPRSAQDVSKAVAILSTSRSPGCEFAVKGGGHTPAGGSANIQGGVTIDMTSLNATVLSGDGKSVAVGAGAVWNDVYGYLDEFSLAAAGGRNGLVGVGGLLLGGGISHFSSRVGWACDGVVGTLSYDVSRAGAVFDTFTDIAASPNFDPYVSLQTGLLYASAAKAWTLSSSAYYTKPVLHPEVYRELEAVPSISNTSKITAVAALAAENPTPPLNWLFATLTFGTSSEAMLDIFRALNGSLYDFNPTGGVTWNFAFEPLPSVMLSHAAATGGNILGLSPEDGNAVILLFSALWPNSSSNDAVYQKGRDAFTVVKEVAERKGVLRKFEYLNYAGPHQSPLASYGADNLEFLRRVSNKYDPTGVFQRKVPGGFKLW